MSVLSAAMTCLTTVAVLLSTGHGETYMNYVPGVLLDEEHIQVECGTPFEEPGYYAIGFYGEDATDDVVVSGEIDVTDPGVYSLTYSIINSEGKSVDTERTVAVMPRTLPETHAEEKTIYLTYDDGPGQYNQELLELLDEYNAKATFFLIGANVKRNLQQVQAILDAGHAVGVHCGNHVYEKLYTSPGVYIDDLYETREMLYNFFGVQCNIFRFPGGSNTAFSYLTSRDKGSFEEVKYRTAAMGMRYYDWNESADKHGGDGENGAKKAIKITETVESPIILQHDTNISCIDETRKILEWGLANGYSFKSLTETVPPVQKK